MKSEIPNPKSEIPTSGGKGEARKFWKRLTKAQNVLAGNFLALLSLVGFRASAFFRPSDFGLRILLLVGILILPGLSSVRAASSETNTPAPAQSLFAHPRNASEGKDPFFPKSMRPYAAAPRTNIPAPAEPVHLKLNGISFGDKPLALINGTPLTVGEERDVKNDTVGRTHVKCIAIKEESVIIEVGGEQQELRLRAKLR